MTERLDFFIGLRGRFVTGDMNKLRTTDHERKPKSPEKHQYEFGIAYQKAEVWSVLAEQFYPWIAAQIGNNQQNLGKLQAWFQQPGLQGKHGGMSMKIGDGDKPDSEGKVNPSTAGCFVFYYTSFGMGDGTKVSLQYPAEPPKAVAGPNANQLVSIDISQIKRGDWVTTAGSINMNGNTGDNFGIFLNCDTVWLLEEGEAILGQADPTQAFNGANLTGSFDPSAGASASFGGAPGTNPGLPGAQQQPQQFNPVQQQQQQFNPVQQQQQQFSPAQQQQQFNPAQQQQQFNPAQQQQQAFDPNVGAQGAAGNAGSGTGFPGNQTPHNDILNPQGGAVPGGTPPKLPGT